MLAAVVIVPAPPAFVPQLMGRAAHELDDIRTAADAALTALAGELQTAEDAAGVPGQIVVVAPDEPGERDHPRRPGEHVRPTGHREHRAAGPVGFGEFGLEVDLPALPAAPDETTGSLPTPLLVGRYLVSRVTGRSNAADRAWSGARWVTTDAASGALLGAELAAAATPIALLLMADGAACHGPKAPRAEDSRAGAYEDSVNAALAAGDPAALRALDPALGAELSATAPLLWPLLTAAAAGQTWTGEVLHHGAPYGVGWTVALWRRVRERA
jgi:hypothetical protein